jgi:hypothetical protein
MAIEKKHVEFFLTLKKVVMTLALGLRPKQRLGKV